MTTLRVAGISGSLRRGSYNSAVLRTAAEELVPAGMTIEFCDIADLPLYDDDVRLQGFPEPVARLRARLAAADAVLIATPEYNYSIPGVLKNAIDWASRPPDQPFDGKPVAIMGASPGGVGTARAQHHLRQCFVFLNALVLNRPEVRISGVRDLVDDAGRLVDQPTRERVRELLEALESWAARLRMSDGD